jgi:hypothetical protein
MLYFDLDIFHKKEECLICFENKVLKPFCAIHKFCDKCNKNWIKQNIYCPMCRKQCVNIKYMKYNYELKNMSIDQFPNNYFDIYFILWHKQSCVNKKHKFHIRKYDNEYRLHCICCNVEEVFQVIPRLIF